MILVEEENLERIDSYLSNKLNISRSKIQKLIKEDNILVNGEVPKTNYKVKLNDKIEILEKEQEEITDIKPTDIPLDIVYEDDYLMIINKKSGLVTHPAPGHYDDTLVNAVLYYLNKGPTTNIRPGIVHRLDKDTSGLMIIAKDEKTQELLSDMISKKEVERKYLAIVDGRIIENTATIDAPIGRNPEDRQKMQVNAKGKSAITDIKVLERFKNNTFIEATLKTGRTHQIRVHLNYIGHTVTNDPIYSKKKSTDFGQMLHSYKIEFTHPITSKLLSYEINPPEEFEKALEKLREE